MSIHTIKIIDGVGDTFRVEPVKDHYAVMKNGNLIGIVDQSGEQWVWRPIWFGDVAYFSNPADAIKHATGAR